VNDLVMRTRGALWWIVSLVVLLVLLGLETDFGRAINRHAAPEEPVAAKPVVVSLLPEYTIKGGTAANTETVARTLFNPTRRPAPIAVQEVAKPRMQKGQFALTGTTVAGERSLAFLKETASGGKARTVKLGDTINGMVVAEVKMDRVKLTLADESEELVLKVASNPRPTPQPPGAPPPGGQPQAPGLGAAGPPSSANVPQEVAPSLAERRRAAREAAAQQQSGEVVTQPQPAGSQAPAQVPPQQAAPQAGAAGTVAQPDNGWAAVFQRYQQRRN
jgi:hypothetical protein